MPPCRKSYGPVARCPRHHQITRARNSLGRIEAATAEEPVNDHRRRCPRHSRRRCPRRSSAVAPPFPPPDPPPLPPPFPPPPPPFRRPIRRRSRRLIRPAPADPPPPEPPPLDPPPEPPLPEPLPPDPAPPPGPPPALAALATPPQYRCHPARPLPGPPPTRFRWNAVEFLGGSPKSAIRIGGKLGAARRFACRLG